MYWKIICKHLKFCAQQDAENPQNRSRSKRGEEGGNSFLKFFFTLNSWRFKHDLGGLSQGDRANQYYCQMLLFDSLSPVRLNTRAIEIGRGGYGRVVKAKSRTAPKQDYAIKASCWPLTSVLYRVCFRNDLRWV
jgi:hypothetical protein